MKAARKAFKSAATVASLTILSRFAGLARDIIISRLLGTSHSADAQVMAYRIPNLLRRLTAEGAASAAFIPVFVAELHQSGKESALRIANTCFYLVTFTMAIITVLGVICAPWILRLYAFGFLGVPGKMELTVLLTRIMFPYMLLVSLAALGMGILNSHHIFSPAAAGPVLLNAGIISSAWFLAPRFEEPAVAVSLGVILGGLLQVVIQLPALLKIGMDFRWSFLVTHPAVRRMGRLMLPGLFGIGITQINVFIDSIFGSLVGEGGVTALYFSNRIMEFVLGVYAISIATAILPTISRIAASEKWEEFSQTFYYGMKMVAFITIPATIGLVLLRSEIVSLLFERGEFHAESTTLTAIPLIYFSLGLTGFSGLKIIIPAFYARHDTRTPVKAALLALVINILANFALLKPLGVGGPALATTLAGYVNFFTLYWIVRRRMVPSHEISFGWSVMKIVMAVVPMTAFLALVRKSLPLADSSLALIATIVAAAGVYFLTARAVGCSEIKEFRMLLVRRGRGESDVGS